MNNDADKITSDAEAWDNGTLGQDEKFAVRTSQEAENALNEALGLQMISVRLQKSLIEDLKFIAKINEVGYQPLIRDVLFRFAKKKCRIAISSFNLTQQRLRARSTN